MILIDELKILWNKGVLTYDVSKEHNFMLRAALMWTINDFPAYGMLSGWSTAGKLACPICMENTKAFTLKHGRKQSWFDCHRCFLDNDHIYRRNKDAFFKNRVERSPPPRRLTGDEVWERIWMIPKVTDSGPIKLPGYGKDHNWTKQSIFWALPYWKTNLIRHNLDVMHIEKNVFDNLFNTVMDIEGKSKDNAKARLDLKEYCKRKELELVDAGNGKIYKPKAKFSFSKDQKMAICEWVKSLRMPDDYATTLDRHINIADGSLSGMKSHDCHVFMERLIPMAFNDLPEPLWGPITELSQFFRDLCSATLWESELLQMERNIPIVLCKLERIFPPAFFNCMEHLPIHLPYEARVGGPIQYRWMYPFERFLNKLKRKVTNKAHVEGSICEAYLTEEIAQFCQYYFASDVPSRRTRVGRNVEWAGESSEQTLSIFNRPGRPAGKARVRFLTDNELIAATLYVLLNCDEVHPYLK